MPAASTRGVSGGAESMSRWTPLPVYLPQASLTHRPSTSTDSRGNYALGTIPFDGWGYESGPFIRGTARDDGARDGPRARGKALARTRQVRDAKFASLSNDPACLRGGSDFGASRRLRFTGAPPRQFTPGGFRRPLTAADYRRAKPAPPPLDVEGGEDPALRRKSTPGGPFSNGARWESLEFYNMMDDARQTPNAHMNHFTGRREPSKHRRNSTTSLTRRVQDDPRAAFQNAVSDVVEIEERHRRLVQIVPHLEGFSEFVFAARGIFEEC